MRRDLSEGVGWVEEERDLGEVEALEVVVLVAEDQSILKSKKLGGTGVLLHDSGDDDYLL